MHKSSRLHLDVDERSLNKASTPPTASSVSGFYQAYPAKSIVFEPGISKCLLPFQHHPICHELRGYFPAFLLDGTSGSHLLNQEEKVSLQNHWRRTLNYDAEIIVGPSIILSLLPLIPPLG